METYQLKPGMMFFSLYKTPMVFIVLSAEIHLDYYKVKFLRNFDGSMSVFTMQFNNVSSFEVYREWKLIKR